MILLDTHVFVWWAGSTGKLSSRARRAVEKNPRKVLSDISLWEVAKLVSLGRLQLDRDVQAWLDQALDETGLEVVCIDASIAARSTRIGARFHGDPADQLIAATAIELGATLITADRNLLDSPAVKTLW